MEEPQPNFNWEQPQRQPAAGLVIVFVKTLAEIVKRVWPFLLLMVFNRKADAANTYELIAAAFAILTIASSIMRFFFFRFSIINEELVIKKGWLKKQTIVVPLQKIQTVHIEQSFLHKALGIVKLSLDTAGSNKTEVTIDALSRSMAEALQSKLHDKAEGTTGTAEQLAPPAPILSLSGKDLLKLSLSANHAEAFFILLSFGFGLYDNLRSINEGFIATATGFIPRNSLLIASFLIAVILIITVFISTARIFFKFFDFRITRTVSGLHVRSGLLNIKERLVVFQKIQFISWRANWVRKRLGLWMLEYKIAGANELKNKMQVEIPVTRYSYVPALINDYHPAPETDELMAVRIHPSYVIRRLFFVGILPALLLMSLTWYWWGEKSFVFLLLPLVSAIKLFWRQKKFKAYMLDEVLYIDRSTFGTEMILLKWYKVQTVTLQQSLHQRSKELATVKLFTAAGAITLPYISLAAARQIMNYGLYQVEQSNEGWI